MKVSQVTVVRLAGAALISATVAGCVTPSGSGTAPPVSATSAPVFNTVIDLDAHRRNRPALAAASHIRTRLGKGCNNCWTRVKIHAFARAHLHGPTNPPGAGQAILVGLIENLDNLETDMYSLKPLTEYEVYLVSNAAGGIDWELVEVGKAAMGMLTLAGRGKYNLCPNHVPPTKSEGDFRNCDYGAFRGGVINLATTAGWQELVARAMGRSKRVPVTEDPGWFTCTDGCCTMN